MITGGVHPVQRTPLIIRPVTEAVPPSPVDDMILRKRKKKTLSGAVSCSRERDDKESPLLSVGLSARGCCSSAHRAESHSTAASARKFMLIESEAAATSASSLPARFSLRVFFSSFPPLLRSRSMTFPPPHNALASVGSDFCSGAVRDPRACGRS